MKKIDLHIHTVKTASDANFVFDLMKLVDYVKVKGLDAVAITNHNVFDLEQFQAITAALPVVVLPGIEIDLEGGHLLLLADPGELIDFDSRCSQVTGLIPNPSTTLGYKEFRDIFPDLDRYILIPHYDKYPHIPDNVIVRFGHSVTAGEVASVKKFVYCVNDESSLVPVYFSDVRIDAGMDAFPIRQTFVDIGDISFQAIKYAISDKNKVSLTKKAGHDFFQATDDGLVLSTGLNVVLGERSSGKSYTLDKLAKKFDRVKYIRQFSLLERSEKDDSDRFNAVLRQSQSLFVQEFLKEFKACVDEVSLIDIDADDRCLELYLAGLLKNAQESERADAFSKTVLFGEAAFPVGSLEGLEKVIGAVMVLVDTEEYRPMVEKFVLVDVLKKLAIELMEHFAGEKEIELKKRWANDLIASIKAELKRRTAATPIPEIDLYSIAMNRARITRFSDVVKSIRQDREIYSQDVQAYRIVAKTTQFGGAGELKNLSGRMLSFTNAYQEYGRPYRYLRQLGAIDGLPAAEYYKFFASIEYKILNRYGFEVSGGERSEFRLLQEISDAMQYDMLLIDEPESSFDNIFLNSEVNQLIKEISKKMPVVLVTHNNTVGASIKPDYIVFTKRSVISGAITYQIFFGHPTDKMLTDSNGNSQPNHEIILNCLEAGISAYKDRGVAYEILKN